MKKTFVFCCMLPLLLLVKAQAQTQTPALELSFKRLKWELGTDVLWVLKKNTLPYSLFLRIHQNDHTAYRFRLGGSYIEYTNPSDTIGGISGGMFKTELDLFMSAGKEWQKTYGRLRAFYGSDVFIGYGHTRSMFNVVNHRTYLPDIKEVRTGLSPFVGVQYFINQHFSVSTETHFSLAYHQYRKVTRDYATPMDSYQVNIENHKYFKADFKPFYIISFNAHF